MYGFESAYQRQFDLIQRLRTEVAGLMHLGDIRTSGRDDSVIFIGRLLDSAENVHRVLHDRFRRHGYTPFLRREGGADIIVARRGLAQGVRSNLLVHAGLLLATLLTTLAAGAQFSDVSILRALRLALLTGAWERVLVALAAGAPFALALLFILGVHELGHYVAARLHGVSVTLPYFIPAPFGLGTFGAFISLKSPVVNRKALFDVGLAGPLAGFIVAAPLMVVGLLLSPVVPAVGGQHLGTSALIQWLVALLKPHAAGLALQLHPIAIAAWFGLLVTGLNLLPVGQLDGGHIAYAVFGGGARQVGLATLLGVLAMGYFLWSGWYTWALFALITGLRHPEPLNSITELDGVRKTIAALTLLLFFLIIIPKPF